MNPRFKAKCTTCQKTFEMTEEQVKEAQAVGVPFSPCCQAVSTVVHVRATLTLPKAKRTTKGTIRRYT